MRESRVTQQTKDRGKQVKRGGDGEKREGRVNGGERAEGEAQEKGETTALAGNSRETDGEGDGNLERWRSQAGSERWRAPGAGWSREGEVWSLSLK